MAKKPAGQQARQPPRDRVVLLVSSLPGIAALVAIIFTALQLNVTHGQLQATQHQLQITEQGQITDRYNAAVTNLGSGSIGIRLGGIYALQRLMQDSPRDQPTIVAVLCAFARDQSSGSPARGQSPASLLPTDVQAALTVVGTRNPAYDGSATVVDLDHASLTD